MDKTDEMTILHRFNHTDIPCGGWIKQLSAFTGQSKPAGRENPYAVSISSGIRNSPQQICSAAPNFC